MTWGASLVFLLTMPTLAFAQLSYIESAAVSSLSEDGEWIKVTGNDDFNTGIYASYSATKAVQGTLVVKMKGDNVITGCLLSEIPRTNGSIILITRGDCPFRTKSQNVAQSGAAGMILQNLPDSPNPLWMSAGMFLPALSYARSIVSIAVSHDIGKSLVQYNSTTVMIQNNGPYDAPTNMDSFKSQIIFYSSGVAVAAVVLILATRICRRRAVLEYRSAGDIHEASGPTREKADELLSVLPKYNFNDVADNGDVDEKSGNNNDNTDTTRQMNDDVVVEIPVETSLTPLPKTGLDCDQCCICISDFQKGEMIMRLPCKHEFHAECVSIWLSEHVDCPLCKDDVYMAVFGAPPTITPAASPTTATSQTISPSTSALTPTTDDDGNDDGVVLHITEDFVVPAPVGFRSAMMSETDATNTDTNTYNSNDTSSNGSSSNDISSNSINMSNVDFRARILAGNDDDVHAPDEAVSFL